MAGMQEGRNAGGQECRQTDGCTERQMYKYTYMYIHMYRNKDVQTYTDEQTDRQCRSAGRQADKHTDVQKDNYILKDRQTDRQNRQAQNSQAQKDKRTNRQIEGSIYVLCKKIQVEIRRLKKLTTSTPIKTKRSIREKKNSQSLL